MLLKRPVLDRIADGSITEVYRRWKRPTVKAGGTLTTGVGQLEILSVEQISESDLDATAARNAGFDTAEELVDSLRSGPDRTLYRIRVALAGEDPRIALRQRSALSSDEVAALGRAFARMDRTVDDHRLECVALLRLLERNEGVRAPDLAGGLGVETKWFKARIRRLKAHGLTESLRVGYRVSPRGRAALRRLG
jgi:hypothetical protein